MNDNERRSAALLFGEELALGEIDRDALDGPDVAEAVRDRPVPSRLSRGMQRRAVQRGKLDYEQYSVAPMLAARAAVLGERAAGPPRFLVRAEAGEADVFAMHELLHAHEVPYLLAVRPPGHDALIRVRDDGVTFGMHGLGDEGGDFEDGLARARAALVTHGIAPDVFVAPGEVLDAALYQLAAKQFAVVTGGAGSVATFGWHPTPLWRGSAVYLPAYVAGARAALPVVRRLVAAQAALWIPLVVRWREETADDLVALCGALQGYARGWDEFLAAVRACR